MMKFFKPLLICSIAFLCCNTAISGEKDFNVYPENVTSYLKRIYKTDHQVLNSPIKKKTFKEWQQDVRPALQQKLGLLKIEESVQNHHPVVKLDNEVDQGDYLQQYGTIETEPDILIPFWLLKPKGDGPWPLGLFPHGHDPVGHNTTAGIYADENKKEKAIAEDRDVAVQAVKKGVIAIAPSVRGLSTDGVPDLYGRHGKRDCRSHLMHCLLAGRTAIGERVWDMQQILNWAEKQKYVDSNHILMMGNSGGGMVTLFTAACDERVSIAIPSCSFAPTTSESGYIFHCDCNMVPGLMELGGLPGVAGLIAPRYLLTVNGRQDNLFTIDDIEGAVTTTKSFYKFSGYGDHFQHRWGEGGHRFYSNLMWPFVMKVVNSKK